MSGRRECPRVASVGTRRLRQLLVVVHVATSVGWLTLAAAELLLIWYAVSTGSAVTRPAALTMAEFLDVHLLQWTAISCVFTGLMLAALTSWGFFRFWWVTAKLLLTVAGLYVGIFLLSRWLRSGVEASTAGGVGAAPYSLQVGPFLLLAMGFMVWLSVAKPWGRLRAGRRAPREAEPHPVWFAAALLAPLADLTASLALPGLAGAPVATLPALVVCLVARSRRLRRPRPERTAPVVGNTPSPRHLSFEETTTSAETG